MPEAHGQDSNSLLALHRRQMDALTPPEIKDPRFDEARKLVVDTLEGRGDPEVTIQPIELTAINTDAKRLNSDPEDQQED